jgi:hypothetical protein
MIHLKILDLIFKSKIFKINKLMKLKYRSINLNNLHHKISRIIINKLFKIVLQVISLMKIQNLTLKNQIVVNGF